MKYSKEKKLCCQYSDERLSCQCSREKLPCQLIFRRNILLPMFRWKAFLPVFRRKALLPAIRRKALLSESSPANVQEKAHLSESSPANVAVPQEMSTCQSLEERDWQTVRWTDPTWWRKCSTHPGSNNMTNIYTFTYLSVMKSQSRSAMLGHSGVQHKCWSNFFFAMAHVCIAYIERYTPNKSQLTVATLHALCS